MRCYANTGLCCHHRYLYWTEVGLSPRISRAPLNGTSSDEVEVLVDTAMVQPLGLTLDLLRGTLYWADPGKQTIEYLGLGGSGRGTLLSGSWVRPFQMSLHRDYLLWTVLGGEVGYRVTDVRNASLSGTLSVVNNLGEGFPLYGMAVVSQNKRLGVSVGKDWGPDFFFVGVIFVLF